MEKEKVKVRLMLRKVLMVLLVLWMVGVFALSQQNGSESGSLSNKVALFFTGGDAESAETLEPVIRKVAHMTEYAIGAMIFYGILVTYPKVSKRAKIISTLAFIVIYAGLDEWHQSFIDSRNGSYVDVLIDTFGGILGMGAFYVIEVSINAIDAKVQEDLSDEQNMK